MRLRFETKLDRIDWRRNIAYARPKKGGKPGEELAQGTNMEEQERESDLEGVKFDLVVGCDGSWSKVRQEMMKVERYVKIEFQTSRKGYLNIIFTAVWTFRSRLFNTRISNYTCRQTRSKTRTAMQSSRSTHTICISGRDIPSC